MGRAEPTDDMCFNARGDDVVDPGWSRGNTQPVGDEIVRPLGAECRGAMVRLGESSLIASADDALGGGIAVCGERTAGGEGSCDEESDEGAGTDTFRGLDEKRRANELRPPFLRVSVWVSSMALGSG